MTLELSDDEALVLFELLADYATKDDGRNLPIQHAAERNALWALEAALERKLTAPLQSDYAERLGESRRRLEDLSGGW